jgi:hypothetical protein
VTQICQACAWEVQRRILSNCAIKVAGRLDTAEAGRPEYGYLPPAQRKRQSARARQARHDVHSATRHPVPLAVDLPFPAWATRPSEKGTWTGVEAGPAAPSDPFGAIPGAHDDPPPL